jgi:hypothetical protein
MYFLTSNYILFVLATFTTKNRQATKISRQPAIPVKNRSAGNPNPERLELKVTPSSDTVSDSLEREPWTAYKNEEGHFALLTN